MGSPSLDSLHEQDIPRLVDLVHETLRISNAPDYPPSIIEHLCADFSTASVRERMARRRTFVLRERERIVATGSLEGDTLYSVFVHPTRQGRGYGRTILGHLETVAGAAGVRTLVVPASLTAHGFYRRAGYRDVAIRDDERHGRVIIMHKDLPGA